MKEVTVVIKCEVTQIIHVDAAKCNAEQPTDERRHNMEKAIARDLQADNVVITGYQTFVRDMEETADGQTDLQ